MHLIKRKRGVATELSHRSWEYIYSYSMIGTVEILYSILWVCERGTVIWRHRIARDLKISLYFWWYLRYFMGKAVLFCNTSCVMFPFRYFPIKIDKYLFFIFYSFLINHKKNDSTRRYRHELHTAKCTAFNFMAIQANKRHRNNQNV